MELETISKGLQSLVAASAAHVVRLEGRRGAVTSGVVWSADGVVVAARHALDEEEPIEAGLPDGGSAPAELAGHDPSTDLAVLRVKASRLHPPAWADPSTVATGQLVVGLSRPGRSIRAELGIVARAAGEWRAPAGGRLDRYLEVSLPLRPGLSGSLVIGAGGGALGLVSAGLLRGAALLLPEPTLRRSVEAILRYGHVRRGYLGIATFPVRLPPAAAKAAGQEGALLVSAVEPESPAEQAGLRLGDVLLGLAGRPVRGPHDLAPALEPERIGEATAVRLLRAGEPKELTLTVGARPRVERSGR
jgi:S1-C subfamily serine protease